MSDRALVDYYRDMMRWEQDRKSRYCEAIGYIRASARMAREKRIPAKEALASIEKRIEELERQLEELSR